MCDVSYGESPCLPPPAAALKQQTKMMVDVGCKICSVYNEMTPLTSHFISFATSLPVFPCLCLNMFYNVVTCDTFKVQGRLNCYDFSSWTSKCVAEGSSLCPGWLISCTYTRVMSHWRAGTYKYAIIRLFVRNAFNGSYFKREHVHPWV